MWLFIGKGLIEFSIGDFEIAIWFPIHFKDMFEKSCWLIEINK